MTGENFANIVANMTADQQANAFGAVIATVIALGILIAIFVIILFFAIYIYISIALMSLAKKTKTKHAWMAWIPVLNFYLMTQIAKQSGLWTLILLAIWVPCGGLAIVAVGVWMFWIIAKKRKFPGWFSLLLLVPIVNLVILGIMAWKKK